MRFVQESVRRSIPLHQMIQIYEELGDASRRSILHELLTGPKHVSEIVQVTSLKQPNVSNHLARMRSRGVVKAEKVGRQVFYSFASSEIAEIAHSAFAKSAELDGDIPFEAHVKAFAKAAIAGDELACAEIIEQLLRHKASIIDIYERVLHPAMTKVGNWYLSDAIDESQEHAASEITLRSMARVVQAFGPIRRIQKTAILGCPQNSWHVIGLRMIADYLRVHGWKTIFLGANVPHEAYLASVKQHRAQLVLVSIITEDHLDTDLPLVKDLAKARTRENSYVIGVGGAGAVSSRSRFIEAGADFLATSLSEFADRYLPEIEKTGRIKDPSSSN